MNYNFIYFSITLESFVEDPTVETNEITIDSENVNFGLEQLANLVQEIMQADLENAEEEDEEEQEEEGLVNLGAPENIMDREVVSNKKYNENEYRGACFNDRTYFKFEWMPSATKRRNWLFCMNPSKYIF